MPPVGLQGLQEEDGHRRSEESRHFARETALEKGQFPLILEMHFRSGNVACTFHPVRVPFISLITVPSLSTSVNILKNLGKLTIWIL